MKELAIISGSSNLPLAEKISSILNIPLTKVLTTTFGNSERRVEINENVRNKDVFVIQSSSDTVNDHLIELLLLLDALKRSSCFRVTTVMPCMPYSRQDRKVKSRVPISAKMVANIIKTAGTDRFLTSELHAPQIGGFFDIPVDNLHMFKVFIPKIKEEHPNNNICIVAPDAGSIKVAKSYAGKLNCDVAMIYKHRSGPGKIDEMKLIGEVKNKTCIIVDDMVDSGGTLIKAANLLTSNGAASVECYCAHAVLSGEAVENIARSFMKKLYVTDTIDNPKTKLHGNIEVLSAAPLFAEAIYNINQEISLSHLFND